MRAFLFKLPLLLVCCHGWVLPAPTSLQLSSALKPARSCHRPRLGVHSQPTALGATRKGEMEELMASSGLIGEDAAVFSLEAQTVQAWASFTAVLVTVMTALYFLWINNDTGYGDDFVRALESLSGGDTSITITLLLGIFAVAHSGLASLRPVGEEIIGARAWRVLFGVVSLPLAVSSVVYFINHRYDGAVLWDVKGVDGVHTFCWLLSYVSFFFLYPSTFNLLEVAAVDKPQLHMWETGIMRITRHPQAIGQGMWCAAHALWVGTSFTMVTSALLMAHHIFAIWNGDRRLEDKYGEAFEAVKERTSVLPFQAVIEGRQELPEEYWKEFARLPYITISVLTVGAYFAHPFMQAGATLLHW
ncbi:unnamed protein product [Chrysoparadoxa australica]